MNRRAFYLAGPLALALVVALLGAPSSKAQGPNARPATWADCERFDGLVTNSSFRPDAGNFDELYMGGDGFKDGVPLISESKPGDADYNGGRWHVNRLKSSVSADKYANACRVEHLDLNDFESTPNYFECPLLPRRER